MGWYSLLLAVCIIGLGLIVFSRHERQQAVTNSSTTTSTTQVNTTPPLVSDHWQVALSVDVCGQVENLPRSADQSSGIITTGNGVVDIEPARAGTKADQFVGAKATLAKFLTSEGVSLTASKLELPKSLGKLAGTYDSSRKCGSKPGRVQLLIWSSPSATTSFAAPSPVGIRYGNGDMFMMAFVPKGASVTRPPAQKLVAAFLKSQTTTTTTSTSTTTTTSASTKTTTSSSTTTTKPVSSTTTTKPVSTTTTKPVSSTTTAG
jgi:guanyl-specific ribonuclease Sa